MGFNGPIGVTYYLLSPMPKEYLCKALADCHVYLIEKPAFYYKGIKDGRSGKTIYGKFKVNNHIDLYNCYFYHFMSGGNYSKETKEMLESGRAEDKEDCQGESGVAEMHGKS